MDTAFQPAEEQLDVTESLGIFHDFGGIGKAVDEEVALPNGSGVCASHLEADVATLITTLLNGRNVVQVGLR